MKRRAPSLPRTHNVPFINSLQLRRIRDRKPQCFPGKQRRKRFVIGLGLLLEDFKEGLRKKESGLDWMLSGSRGNVLILCGRRKGRCCCCRGSSRGGGWPPWWWGSLPVSVWRCDYRGGLASVPFLHGQGVNASDCHYSVKLFAFSRVTLKGMSSKATVWQSCVWDTFVGNSPQWL